MPLLASDLYLIMKACIEGTLATAEVKWSSQSAATVVMAASGYPGSYKKVLSLSLRLRLSLTLPLTLTLSLTLPPPLALTLAHTTY